MSEKKILFNHCVTEAEIDEIYNFNVQAFADSHDFSWTKENIENEIGKGWNLFAVKIDDDILCALFMREHGPTLYTKNTPIKLVYQGNGFSHIIKEFYEEFAKDNKHTRVVNYCPVDNFRMISLNEGHGYKKTGNVLGENHNMIEWEKIL